MRLRSVFLADLSFGNLVLLLLRTGQKIPVLRRC
jgi:hypothetical protein